MLDGFDHAARSGMRIIKRLGNRIDPAAGNADRLELAQPVLGRILRERGIDQAVDEIAVLDARAIAAKALVLRPFGVAQNLGGARKLPLVSDCERHHGVGGPIGGVGHDAGVPVAETAALAAGDKIVRGDINQHRERSLVQRKLHLLPLARAPTRVKRRKNGIARQHAGAHVDNRHAVFRRLPIRLAADAHQARLRLQHEIIAGQRSLGPARSVAGDGAANEPRSRLLEPGVGEAPFVQRSQPEIIDEDVGFLDQPGKDFLPGRVGHVERQGALVAVDAEKIGGLGADERRAPMPRIVAVVGRLDLDDVGAHVAQHHGAERTGEDTGEIDDADSGEWAPFAHGDFLRMEGGALRSLAQPAR